MSQSICFDSSLITHHSSLGTMSTHKSDKELAFLHDLYVATDWGERFAELVDEHVKLPRKGRALYVASGTGGHAPALGELPTVSDVEKLAGREALEAVESWTSIEEFDFASGGEFLGAPLVRDFLLERWLDSLPDEDARAAVLREVERIIDEDRHEGEFSLSIKATIVVGRKPD